MEGDIERMAKRTFKASPSSSSVTCGLFGNRSKNKDNKNSSSSKPRTMQEYIDRANQVGNEFDQLQQKALSRYSKSVNSSGAVEVIEYQNAATGRKYSEDQLRHLFKFVELRGGFVGTYEDWIADKLSNGTLIECYEDKQIYSNSATAVNGAYEYGMLPGPGDYDPPEYPDPIEADNYTEEFYLDLDCDILLDDDGSWDYADNNCPWADVNGDGSDIYSDEYSFLRIADIDRIVDDTNKLLETLLPIGQAGKYRISGKVTLAYDIHDVEYYPVDVGYESDERLYVEDSGEVDFNFAESKIENFKYVKVGNL